MKKDEKRDSYRYESLFSDIPRNPSQDIVCPNPNLTINP